MLQKLKKKSQGFTIIEVLIVLAIAGLILLIVFLAVPALQRNSRNTSRRNDVARILGQVQEVLNNNNNDMNSITDPNVRAGLGSLAYYKDTDVSVQSSAPATGAANNASTNQVHIYTGAKCAAMGSGGGNGAQRDTTNPRAVVAVFRVEPDSTNNRVCQST